MILHEGGEAERLEPSATRLPFHAVDVLGNGVQEVPET